MAGLNVNGIYDVKQLSIGRGICFFAKTDPVTDKPGGYENIGNLVSFNNSSDSDTLQHTSTQNGIGVIDAEEILSATATLSFETESNTFENIARFWLGEIKKVNNPGTAGISAVDLYDDITVGRFYQIYDPTTKQHARGIDKSDLTVKAGVGGSTPLSQGTDYTVDEVSGLIYIIPGKAAANGDKLNVTLAANAYIQQNNFISLMTQTAVVGALKFIDNDPVDRTGKKTIYDFPRVSLIPDGDFGLITDNSWRSLPFKCTLQRSGWYNTDPFGFITRES